MVVWHSPFIYLGEQRRRTYMLASKRNNVDERHSTWHILVLITTKQGSTTIVVILSDTIKGRNKPLPCHHW